MADETPRNKIDFSLIDFPTDALTVKQLRTQMPESFSWDEPPFVVSIMEGTNRAFLQLGEAMHGEREIAEYAYLRKRKSNSLDAGDDEIAYRPGISYANTRQELIDALQSAYSDLGLFTGPKAFQETVKRIEAQAEKQAGIELD